MLACFGHSVYAGHDSLSDRDHRHPDRQCLRLPLFRESLFSIDFFSNRLIFAGIAVELLLQLFIVYHPLGNKIFSTAPLSWRTWLVLIPFAALLLIAEEMRKLIAKKRFSA